MTKKKKKQEYDFQNDLNTMEIPLMAKKGFEYHIQEKDIEIKSKSDLQKEYNKFMEGA